MFSFSQRTKSFFFSGLFFAEKALKTPLTTSIMGITGYASSISRTNHYQSKGNFIKAYASVASGYAFLTAFLRLEGVANILMLTSFLLDSAEFAKIKSVNFSEPEWLQQFLTVVLSSGIGVANAALLLFTLFEEDENIQNFTIKFDIVLNVLAALTNGFLEPGPESPDHNAKR